MSDISQVVGIFTYKKGNNASGVSTFSKAFTFNQKLNAYVLEVDLADLDEGCQYKCDVTAYIDDTPFVYPDSDFYFYRNPEFITDRTADDVQQVKELRKKWYEGSISDSDKARWNAGLKGSINPSDITRIGTKHSQIEQYFNIHTNDYLSRYNSVIGSYLFTLQGFDNMISALTESRNTVNALTPVQRELFILISNLEYEQFPPPVPYNYFDKWNDIEKFVLAYFRTLIYDIQEYKPASITEYTPEPPYTYMNYLYSTDNLTNNELHAVATDDEMIGLI